jgi:thiol-disulfide isomerase/thioredoxin
MLLDLEGSPVPFSQFRGQVIFLNFWATWCPPCRAELPDIQRLYDQYGERMAIILASQEGAEALESFLNEKGYVLPVYRLVQNPPEKLMASTLPTTFLITGNDRITIRKTGAARWNGEYFKNYLESLLGDSGAGR